MQISIQQGTHERFEKQYSILVSFLDLRLENQPPTHKVNVEKGELSKPGLFEEKGKIQIWNISITPFHITPLELLRSFLQRKEPESNIKIIQINSQNLIVLQNCIEVIWEGIITSFIFTFAQQHHANANLWLLSHDYCLNSSLELFCNHFHATRKKQFWKLTNN